LPKMQPINNTPKQELRRMNSLNKWRLNPPEANFSFLNLLYK
jgi:hypothetical protein